MKTLRAPAGASEPLVHALGLIDGGVQNSLKELDPYDRNLFWNELAQFAAAQVGHQTNIPLIAGEHIPELVRETLRETETKTLKALRGVSGPDRDHFWQLLRDGAAEQAAKTRPKVRAGGQVSF